MKKLFLFFLAAAVISVFPQERIVVSPAIGPLLDKQEQGFYQLLPAVKGFREASFFLNNDSSVTAVIKYDENGTLKDSLYPFKNPRFVHDYLVQKLVYYLKDNKNNQFNVFLYNGAEFNAYLYSVDSAQVNLFELKEKQFLSFGNDEIYMLEKTEKPSASIFHYAGGCLVGGFAGGMIGGSTHEREEYDFLNLEGMERACIGGIIGGLAGAVIGGIIGSSGTEVNNYQPREDGFYYLNEDAVFK